MTDLNKQAEHESGVTHSWTNLPDEIKMLTLSKLDPDSLSAFALTCRAAHSLCQDASLCEHICTTYFPLAAARKRQNVNLDLRYGRTQSPPETWCSFLRATSTFRASVANRRASNYYELSLTDLWPGHRIDVGFDSTYSSGHLAVWRHAWVCILIIDLSTRGVVTIQLDSGSTVQSVELVDGLVSVLTNAEPTQHVLLYEFSGTLKHRLDTNGSGFDRHMTNQDFHLLHSSTSHEWITLARASAQEQNAASKVLFHDITPIDDATFAIDDQYFYQRNENTGEFSIFHIESQSCISKTDLHLRIEGEEDALLFSMDGHVYVCCSDRMYLIYGAAWTSSGVIGEIQDEAIERKLTHLSA